MTNKIDCIDSDADDQLEDIAEEIWESILEITTKLVNLLNDRTKLYSFLTKVDKLVSMDDSKYPAYLYRYRSVERALDEIEKEYIFLSPISSFKDPFDTMFPLDQLFNYNNIAIEDNKKGDVVNFLNKLSKSLFTILDEDIDFVFDSDGSSSNGSSYCLITKMLRNLFRVCCFTERHDSFAMWDNYTNGHKGVCIQYDTQKLKQKGIKCYKVRYSDKIYDEYYKDSDENINMLQYIVNCVLTKYKDYSYENEWRVFTNSLTNDYTKSTKGSISKVYLGVNISDGEKNKILELCKTKNIEVVQLSSSLNEYKLYEHAIKLY